MKSLRMAGLAAVLALIGLVAMESKANADIKINFDRYAAISFSPSTGKYGYAFNYGSRASAESAAMAKCKEADAKIVGWVKGGWLALAVGDDNVYGVGWEFGAGAYNVDAKKRALKECKEQGKGAKLKICICSGDLAPEIFE